MADSAADSVKSNPYSVATDEFISQLKFSIPVGLVLIGLYCILRYYFSNTFELRKKLKLKEDTNINNKSRKRVTFPKLSNSAITWMWQIMKMSKSIYFKHAGFDALVFRLYLDSCFYICLASIPYTIC
eukprot:13298_1